MKRANDMETLSALSLAALELDPLLWEPVGLIPGKISDYSKRDALTTKLGSQCGEVENLRQFLKMSYVSMGDNDFGLWDDAYISCQDKEIDDWIIQLVENPPQKSFNDKYNSMLEIIVKKKSVNALPHLKVAAIAAAENGPYGDILRATEETVATDFGGEMPPEDKKALEDTLLAIAQKVDTQKAKDVAFQLASSGSEEKAAQLLPTIYANYYKNNSFSYAVAAVELGNCGGEKKAVIHFAEVLDKSIRWSIQNEITEPLRSSKSKLAKCDSEGDWAILQSPTPVSSGKDIKSWTAEVQEQYASKGYKVKLQKEKKITLE
ncbi:MAG: hypothetical protein VX278_22960 [Myxococcota bacterium]|nr:hypothetical protein [Myxococcota bacterium]